MRRQTDTVLNAMNDRSTAIHFSVESGAKKMGVAISATGWKRLLGNFKSNVTTIYRLSSGSYKPRQLGSLHIEGRGRSTSKPSVLGPDKTIGKIGG